MPPLNLPSTADLVALNTATFMFFNTLVRTTPLYSLAETVQSVSTPTILQEPVSLQYAADPRPTGPATGMTMSAPSCTKDSAKERPSSSDSKLPVKEPSLAAVLQPSTSTLVPISWL